MKGRMNMYNTVKLEKGLYNIASKTFTQALEELDSSDNYKDTEMSGLDAFERQLKRFDIKVSGEQSDMVEKFFSTTQSAVLFPEFVRRCIRKGMDDASVLPYITAARTKVSGVDYRGLSISSAGEDTAVSEGGDLPVTTIKLATGTVSLEKLGRRISASYESVRLQRLDIFATILRTIGARISGAVNKKAVTALCSSLTASDMSGDALTYADLISMWSAFGSYNMTTILASAKTMADILKLEEMKNCTGEYMTKGTVRTPFGALLVKCSGLDDDKLLCLDRSCALEMISSGDVVVDFEKLAASQMDDVAFTVTVGFSRIISDAVKVLSV